MVVSPFQHRATDVGGRKRLQEEQEGLTRMNDNHDDDPDWRRGQ
jgi:hypothetical protein